MTTSIVLALAGLAVFGALAAGLAVGVVVARRAGGSEPDAAVVEAVVARAMRDAGAQRDESVRQAVESLVTVAADRLGSQSMAHAEALDARAARFDAEARRVGDTINTMAELVGELRRERAQQQGELAAQINEAIATNRDLAETTRHLREALASPKARGQWGERMAEDVLARAGLIEGVNYRRAARTPGGTVPDFTFLVPGDLELNMDVKFPVDNYLRWLEAGEDQRPALAKAFVRDVRNRIKELTARDYIERGRTLDQLLLFIPNESVYAFLHEQDPEVVDVALGHRIVLCSPFTLFSVLAVVRQASDNFRLERTSDEILACLGDVRTHWDKFTDQLDKVGKHLGTLHNSFDELGGVRRRQVERQLDRIDQLQADRAGAEVRELPRSASA